MGTTLLETLMGAVVLVVAVVFVTAAVATEGLLGGKYISLDPGGAEELIAPGGETKITQASINLEGLLGKAFFGGDGGGGG